MVVSEDCDKQMKITPQSTLMTERQERQERDRYSEATQDVTGHLMEKIVSVLRTPDAQAKLQAVLDPVINHIINRIFPYILLSAILFLILFLLSVGTFWMVLRTAGIGSSSIVGGKAV